MESVRDDERCGRSKEIKSWLATGLGLGLLCWSFKGVEVEIPGENPAVLKSGQWHFHQDNAQSPQVHPCHRLLEQDGCQDSS